MDGAELTMSTGSNPLHSIKTFSQLVKYLRDELEWPIESDDFEELTFDYAPEELGLDAATAVKIKEIKQLRPLTSKQPWGIFFVNFAPKQLPVVALRRILSTLVIKKRQSANKSQQAAWRLHDLLFISSYGETEHRDITFAHFAEEQGSGDLPTLRLLGWDDEDTKLKLDFVEHELKTKLRWPRDESNIAAWRAEWSAAFKLRPREVIKTSRQLAVRLADLARGIRKRANDVLAIESSKGPLRRMHEAFKEALIHDLSMDDFADMYAQTIAYGLLTARISRPAGLVADNLSDMVPVTNPFLKDLLETFLAIGGRKGKLDFDELGVNEVVQVLRDADMEAVLRDFGDRNPQEDPVIHFYELFLKEYDAEKRMQRGVFYTPRPVVSYMVRSVHELLQNKFGLVDGLADTTTWEQMAERNKKLVIPIGMSPDDPFVQILDPATGTGTFLVEAIDVIHKTMEERWKEQGQMALEFQGLWNDYVPKHLLPRLHGFELMMAPYAIAHMKIGLKLQETGYRFGSEERARIYLTNSLEPPSDATQQREFEDSAPALAHEALAVNSIKRRQRFTVVIGNPPYANYSANLSPSARRIVDKYRTYGGVAIRERNQLQFERNIQDDYVKFISIAEAHIENANTGVLGYITNATMLASTSLRGMREHLTKGFDGLFELNLHGGLNEASAIHDENVFDIAQSVAVHIYFRSTGNGTPEVSYADLFGERSAKYSALTSQSASSTEWRLIEPDPKNCSFRPQDAAGGHMMRRLDSAFAKYGAGVKTGQDAVVIGFNDKSLVDALRSFDPLLLADNSYKRLIQPILYRPFDVRKIFYHEDLVASRSLPTMKHITAGTNIGLVGASTLTSPERFSVNVSRLMVEMKTGTHDRGTTFFPLYQYENLLGSKLERMHNLTRDFVNEWVATTKTSFLPTGQGDIADTSGPEDVIAWLYGLFHSPEYRTRYRATLAQGFPIILLTSNKQLLREMIRLGEELISLHLLESTQLDTPLTTYVGSSYLVEKPSYSHKTVWIDRAQTCGFSGVPETVWTFQIGGYPVCEKWLKDRKGRMLSMDDSIHYNKIVVALSETIRLMKKIDEVIDEHGGWPGAFASAQSTTKLDVPIKRAHERTDW
jgi:predicted helicase